MKIKPDDIRKKGFRLRLRGFDIREVDTFLEELSEEYHLLVRKIDTLARLVKSKNREVRQYKERERLIKSTLLEAKKAAAAIKANAQQEAQLIVSDAQSKADAVIQQAESRLQKINGDILELKKRRDRLTLKLSSFLQNQLRTIDLDKELQAQEPKLTEKIVYLKTLPQDRYSPPDEPEEINEDDEAEGDYGHQVSS
ncbi:MAG: DivIVA domain-containing protein [Deltaproteobacteria bacterium]|nr:DivIVA domain-containing protein [Deltaproteobacteria bacterium]